MSGIRDGVLPEMPVVFLTCHVRDETSYMCMDCMGYYLQLVVKIFRIVIQNGTGWREQSYRSAAFKVRKAFEVTHIAKDNQLPFLSDGQVFYKATLEYWPRYALVSPLGAGHVQRHHAIDINVGRL